MDQLPVGAGSEVRISDADRERTARILQQAAAEGRLTLDEVEQRLTAVYGARTASELEPATRDLPVAGTAPTRPGGPRRSRLSVAIMSLTRRGGGWSPARRHFGAALWGRTELDLRGVRFAEPYSVINAFAVMGAVEIVVPDDVTVEVNGVGVMGRFAGEGGHGGSDVDRPWTGAAPVVRIRGLAVWGAVEVRRRKRR